MFNSDPCKSDHIKWPTYQKSPSKKDEAARLKEEHEKARFASLDAMFVKAIFPFIEKRIDEEGIWRKSGNFNRIKKLQKELQSIIATPERLKQPKVPVRRRSSLSRSGSKSSFKSSSSKLRDDSMICVQSARSFDSLSSNTSLDDIDDEDNTYNVHDMTLLVKRILIPVFQKSCGTVGFFKLVDHLSLKIPQDILDISAGRDQMIRDRDPRMYANFISCLSLFTLFHLKLLHSMYETSKKDQTEPSTPQMTKGSSKTNLNPTPNEHTDSSAMSLLCSLFGLLSKTANHSASNKMIPTSLATLFLPLFYPSSLSMTSVSSSDRLLVDNEQDSINKRLTAMLSFIINYWPQITSATSLPNTFMTDFKLLQQSSNKGSKRKSEGMDDDESVMSTCVRFAQPSVGGANSTIDETQIELARMYAHVQATQDKKMIKKLNRAGVIIPSKKNCNKVLIPSNNLNTPPSSAVSSPGECPRTEPKKLKGFKALLAGSPFVRSVKKRKDNQPSSPASYNYDHDNNSLG